ncbi:LysR family transcriptional regulator [Sphingomonas psychrotolerans]|uniref:LysR family transcriptional regulator n=1 Tax=Sphingomonas psychrotolerans TaxID=1327635 RepID=A0A2K8MJ08_9SPHN|nr:LysR family transcriptional regulator [Sphingomonas psychrotolerans]ATY33843.1 LysR family transcriptional regulator [Sphingomonas psychrotolerans]
MSALDIGIDWERQRAFLAVISEGSLSAAARRIGVAQPTVRRRIEELEVEIGTPLFTRSPSGLLPTARAEALAGHVRAMALAAEAFVRSASAEAGEIAGRVRITASDVVAIEVLPPILATLSRKHPELVIELSPSNRNEDVLRREADVAVRMVAPQQEALVAQRIGAIPLGLHATADYLAARGTPRSLAEVRGHVLIGVEHDTPVLRALQAGGLPIRRDDFAFRSDHDLAQLAAIRAGLGIGVCQVPLAAREGLVRLVPDAFGFDLETWVVCHEDLRGVARVRAVFDALVTGLRRYLRPLPSGEGDVTAPRTPMPPRRSQSRRP